MSFSFLKKAYRSLTLRCFGALAVGIIVVSFIAVELALIAAEEIPQATDTKTAGNYVIRFPENEDTLRAMAARMMADMQAPQNSADLATIEPAAE